MINFENTEIAFKSKSDTDLFKAHLLFKIMSKKMLQKTGAGLANFALKINFPIKWAVKPTIYNHFVGGETIEECNETVRLMEKFNVGAILDYSVEGKESEEDIQNALRETLQSIKNAAKDSNIPFAVFKPTAFASHHILEKASTKEKLSEQEQKEATAFKTHVNTLCKAAYEGNIPILIDAEDVCFQNFIDETAEEMMRKYNKKRAIVFNTWQMYRHDRLEHLRKWYERAEEGNYFVGAKFVRGAYMEREREKALKQSYESPICKNKEGTDKNYDDALRLSVEHINRVTIFNGTHNESSNQLLADLIIEKGIDKKDSRVWFSQLYGMSDHISFNMADAGFNVAKYVPYGPVKHVLPYLFRRVEENTSVEGQTGRELGLLIKEKKRRRNFK